MLKKIRLSLATKLSSLWLRKHPTFVFACKINASQDAREHRYRVTVVQTGRSFLEGEEYAADVVRQWLEQHRDRFDTDPELKWLTGRPIVLSSLELESEAVRRLIMQMRRDRTQISSVVEEITTNGETSGDYHGTIRVR